MVNRICEEMYSTLLKDGFKKTLPNKPSPNDSWISLILKSLIVIAHDHIEFEECKHLKSSNIQDVKLYESSAKLNDRTYKLAIRAYNKNGKKKKIKGFKIPLKKGISFKIESSDASGFVRCRVVTAKNDCVFLIPIQVSIGTLRGSKWTKESYSSYYLERIADLIQIFASGLNEDLHVYIMLLEQ